MANKHRHKLIKQHEGEAVTGDTSTERQVQRLGRSFAKFHREHRPGTRVPQALRDTVLQALRSGTPEQDVRRACRISRAQLDRWRKSHRASVQRFELDEHKPRVFPVVDEESVVGIEQVGEHAAQSLQLRVGRWDIYIRQVES